MKSVYNFVLPVRYTYSFRFSVYDYTTSHNYSLPSSGSYISFMSKVWLLSLCQFPIFVKSLMFSASKHLYTLFSDFPGVLLWIFLSSPLFTTLWFCTFCTKKSSMTRGLIFDFVLISDFIKFLFIYFFCCFPEFLLQTFLGFYPLTILYGLASFVTKAEKFRFWFALVSEFSQTFLSIFVVLEHLFLLLSDLPNFSLCVSLAYLSFCIIWFCIFRNQKELYIGKFDFWFRIFHKFLL